MTSTDIKTKTSSFRTKEVPYINNLSGETGDCDVNWELVMEWENDMIHALQIIIKSITGIKVDGKGLTVTHWIRAVEPLYTYHDIKPTYVFVNTASEAVEVKF